MTGLRQKCVYSVGGCSGSRVPGSGGIGTNEGGSRLGVGKGLVAFCGCGPARLGEIRPANSITNIANRCAACA